MKKLIIVQFIITILSMLSIGIVYFNIHTINNSDDWELVQKAIQYQDQFTNIFLATLFIIYIFNITIFILTIFSNKLGGNKHGKKR